MFGGETAFCQGGAYLILAEAREFLPELLDAAVVPVPAHLLFKISQLQIISLLHIAGEGLDQPEQTL